MSERLHSEINPDAFRYAVSKVGDGTLFEKFAHSFLSAAFNYEFIPAGGTKDRGIDGLEYVYQKKGFKKTNLSNLN